MNIPLRLLKKAINQIENTVYDDSQNTVIIPVMVAYSVPDSKGVNVTDLIFTREPGHDWALTGIAK